MTPMPISLRRTPGARFATMLLLVGCLWWLAGCGSQTEDLAITDQPRDTTGFVNFSARFTVGAKGASPLAFQWRRNGVAIAGATGPTYSTPALSLADSGTRYSVVVSNPDGSVTSSDATLTVFDVPAITTQPVPQTVAVGATATFSVTATGGGTLSYQWLRNDLVIVGATNSTFTTPATVAADDGAIFSAVVANGAGFVISSPATLTVTTTPTILNQPASQLVTEGRAATFSVVAVGGNLQYQWRRGAADIPGANAAIYVTPVLTAADNGAAYSVVISNPRGTVTSLEVTATVVAPAASAPPALPAEVTAGRTTTPAEGFVLVRKSDGTVWAWGQNADGLRGNDTTSAPNEVPGLVILPAGRTATQVAAGGVHALVLLDNGDVYAWGRNSAGQLGLGDLASRLKPIRVTLPLPAIAIAAGGTHSLAVLNDGRVYAWGLNDFGQLGDGGRISTAAPQLVSSITTAVAVAAGNDHSLALLADGTVMAWGANAAGQLGDGTKLLRRTPVAVASGIARIRAGADISAAITPGRLVLAWGRNAVAQLGLGASPTTDMVTPTGVFADAVDASSANSHLLIAASSGVVRGAGGNASGEIGDGTRTARNTFTPATGVANALTVAAGGNAYSLALLADGTVFAWGDNTAEQLANPAQPTGGTPTPAQVPGFDAIP